MNPKKVTTLILWIYGLIAFVLPTNSNKLISKSILTSKTNIVIVDFIPYSQIPFMLINSKLLQTNLMITITTSTSMHVHHSQINITSSKIAKNPLKFITNLHTTFNEYSQHHQNPICIRPIQTGSVHREQIHITITLSDNVQISKLIISLSQYVNILTISQLLHTELFLF